MKMCTDYGIVSKYCKTKIFDLPGCTHLLVLLKMCTQEVIRDNPLF